METEIRTIKQRIVVEDCERMSNEELFRFLMKRVPALATTVQRIDHFNRETVIAFLRLFSDETR